MVSHVLCNQFLTRYHPLLHNTDSNIHPNPRYCKESCLKTKRVCKVEGDYNSSAHCGSSVSVVFTGQCSLGIICIRNKVQQYIVWTNDFNFLIFLGKGSFVVCTVKTG